MNHPMDTPIIIWPVFEPASCQKIEITVGELNEHVLLVGSTGSGKSSLLTSATRQVIGYQAQSPELKAGLLVLDAKCDDLVTRVREAAQACGRAEDVVVLGPQGDHGLDLFGCLHSLDDVDRLTRQLMLGTEKFGSGNAYWEHATAAMLDAAFTLIVAARIPPTFAVTVEFLRRWFLSQTTSLPVLQVAQRLKAQGGPRHPMLATALDQVELWQSLDSRTKSNLQSCLINVMRPLLSPAAGRCLSPCGQDTFNPGQAVHEGKVCVVSVNALAEPDLARFFFRLAKELFFNAVQLRRQPARLCGLIADEFPLVVASADVEQLATVRSKFCFVLAATQGVLSLSERIGVSQARALLNHFNTTVYLRTRETETSVLASLALGTRQEISRQKPMNEYGDIVLFPPNSQPKVKAVDVCPMGALGQLSPHQAYIVFADGRRTEFPVWFVPWFELEPAAPAPPAAVNSDLYFSARHTEELMRWAGFKNMLMPEVVAAAGKLCDRQRQKLLEEATLFFRTRACLVPEGLNTLPAGWLAALPKILWKLKKPEWTHLPYFVDRLAVEDGLLRLHFAQEQLHTDGRLTSWDRIRIAVNASLYPNRYRPLSQRHAKRLSIQHPELHAALNSVTPAME
jgi:hypothetical protein